MIMDLYDQIRALWDGPHPGFRVGQRNTPRCPTADKCRALESGSGKTGIGAVIRRTGSCRVAGIQKDKRMMHDAPVLRAEFQSAYIRILIEVERQNKALKLIRPIRSQGVFRRKRQHPVRLAAEPTIREYWRLRLGRV